MLGKLTDLEMKNLLSSQVLGRLACTHKKQPYIVPVTYTYDGEFIYGQTNEGMKLTMLRQNPKVCFEVDRLGDMRNWESVIVFGSFEELADNKAAEARELLFGHVFPLMTSSTIHPHEHAVSTKVEDVGRIKFVMYKIVIDKMTGRFEQG